MQASSQLLLNFRDTNKIPIEITNEIDFLLESLEKKIKLTPRRKEFVFDHVCNFYDITKDYTKIAPNEIVGIVLYEFLSFLSYQLLCVWLDIKQNVFMKKRNQIIKIYPDLNKISDS